MWRILHGLAIAALMSSAVYVYSVKYDTILASEQVVKLKHLIDAEQSAIGMARAEWTFLSRPERIQALADQHLDLQPMKLDQIVRASDLPDRQAKVDTIGRKLEALGLGLPTSTPQDVTGTIPTTPSPAATASTTPVKGKAR